MWRSKKFIVIALLATVLLVGSIGGIALAQTENGDDSQPKALLDRVCEIYEDNTGVAIDSGELQKAFNEAQSEAQAKALENRLAKMVENGVIDETQKQELLDWWQSRPDMPFNFGFGGRVGFHGMGGPRGFWGPCAPAE